MDFIVQGVSKSRTRLSNFRFHIYNILFLFCIQEQLRDSWKSSHIPWSRPELGGHSPARDWAIGRCVSLGSLPLESRGSGSLAFLGSDLGAFDSVTFRLSFSTFPCCLLSSPYVLFSFCLMGHQEVLFSAQCCHVVQLVSKRDFVGSHRRAFIEFFGQEGTLEVMGLVGLRWSSIWLTDDSFEEPRSHATGKTLTLSFSCTPKYLFICCYIPNFFKDLNIDNIDNIRTWIVIIWWEVLDYYQSPKSS